MDASTLSYTFVTTADGSPTLRFGSGENLSEAMHSLKGAFSETVYIYGTAIERALSLSLLPRVMSLGLGLGYVELLAAGLCLKQARARPSSESEKLKASFGGESFEIVPELREWFVGWATGEGPLPDDFRIAYDEILTRTAQETEVDRAELQTYFASLLREGRWQVREALDSQIDFREPFGCICFDAFSSKTSPDLWTEPFLLEFFTKACAPGCVLSTYACTGALKRSLRAAGFDVQIREGFSSKRDSTFAVRPPLSQDETSLKS